MDKALAEKIKNGAVGVIPTDTLYGLVCSALNTRSVAKIYVMKKRSPNKPLIILVSSLADISLFDVSLDKKEKKIVDGLWPGPVSVAFVRKIEKFEYLECGTNTIAFRIPADDKLREFLKMTGPLVAPSANTEGGAPASTISEARDYFGDSADFYIDGGTLADAPSTLIKIENGEIKVLRKGAFLIK